MKKQQITSFCIFQSKKTMMNIILINSIIEHHFPIFDDTERTQLEREKWEKQSSNKKMKKIHSNNASIVYCAQSIRMTYFNMDTTICYERLLGIYSATNIIQANFDNKVV